MTTPPDGPAQDVPAGFRVVELSREPVELYKILKFEGLLDSGGQARAAVAAGRVSVNQKIETQKRKKIRSGDTIEFEDHKIFICYSPVFGPEQEPVPAAVATRRKSSSKPQPKSEKAARTSGSGLVPRAKKP